MPICLNNLCVGGIVIYLLGIPLCYIIIRAMIFNRNDGEWVVMEKIITIIMSLGSWVTMLVYILLIAAIHINLIDPDKKCKW